MKEVSVMGIDLAKRIFQVHGVDANGHVVVRKKIGRNQLLRFIAQTPPCLIGMEACSGSHFWSRQFQKFGHDVRSISPQFVKPYVKTNKNDANDAEAICEAVQRPNMRFVPVKTIEQQDIQAAHRIRQRLVRQRTALCNEIRGLLNEYGVIVAQGVKTLKRELPGILENEGNELTILFKKMLWELYRELCDLDQKVDMSDRRIKDIFNRHEVCSRLAEVEGVGPLTATALVASVGDAKVFKNGRQMAAWIGLVPRQYSSGGKTRLGGISKRGDIYLRTILIHGARAAILRAGNREDKKARWIMEKVRTRGKNKAAVALANKNVRVLWHIMARGETYRKVA